MMLRTKYWHYTTTNTTYVKYTEKPNIDNDLAYMGHQLEHPCTPLDLA